MREGVREKRVQSPSLQVEPFCREVLHQKIFGNEPELPHALHQERNTYTPLLMRIIFALGDLFQYSTTTLRPYHAFLKNYRTEFIIYYKLTEVAATIGWITYLPKIKKIDSPFPSANNIGGLLQLQVVHLLGHRNQRHVGIQDDPETQRHTIGICWL
jgi:hypothetical protein